MPVGGAITMASALNPLGMRAELDDTLCPAASVIVRSTESDCHPTSASIAQRIRA